MLDRRTLFTGLVFTALAMQSLPVHAAGVEDAQRIIDRNLPLRCDIAVLEHRAVALDPASAEGRALQEQLHVKYQQMQNQFQAMWPEYMAVMSRLTPEQRSSVEHYSQQMGEQCNVKACGAPSCTMPVKRSDASAPMPARPQKKEHYRPPVPGIEKQPPGK